METTDTKDHKTIGSWMAIGGTLLFSFFAFSFLDRDRTEVVDYSITPALIPWATGILCIYIGMSFFYLLKKISLHSVTQYFASVNWLIFGSKCIVVSAGYWFYSRFISSHSNIVLSQFSSSHSYLTFLICSIRPLEFLVMAVIYWGPIFFLAIRFWPKIVQTISSYGPGMITFVSICILFFMETESRSSTDMHPLMVVVIVAALKEVELSRAAMGWFTALSVILTKIWIPINKDGKFMEHIYFMNFGPINTNKIFYAEMACVIPAMILFFYLVRANRQIEKS